MLFVFNAQNLASLPRRASHRFERGVHALLTRSKNQIFTALTRASHERKSADPPFAVPRDILDSGTTTPNQPPNKRESWGLNNESMRARRLCKFFDISIAPS